MSVHPIDPELMDQVHAAAFEPERLSWEEICQRYVNQWVVLVDIA